MVCSLGMGLGLGGSWAVCAVAGVGLAAVRVLLHSAPCPRVAHSFGSLIAGARLHSRRRMRSARAGPLLGLSVLGSLCSFAAFVEVHVFGRPWLLPSSPIDVTHWRAVPRPVVSPCNTQTSMQTWAATCSAPFAQADLPTRDAHMNWPTR